MQSAPIAVLVLRSITPLTGALAGGLGVAVPILAATFYELKFGRPSSTAGLAIPFAIIWGGLAAAAGAAVGRGIHQMVAPTRWAGPLDRRVAAILLMLVVAAPSVLAIYVVRRMEAGNAPRVIRSTGEVVRAEGRSVLTPVRSATFLWTSLPHPDHPRGDLRWNGRRVDVRFEDDRLLLSADEVSATAIDISRFDYARETYGVTAALSTDGREWLALLVQLRATGGRELLFIFNPEGVLVHEELLERRRGRAPRVGLGAAGPAGGPQEIVLDRGVPIRYYVGELIHQSVRAQSGGRAAGSGAAFEVVHDFTDMQLIRQRVLIEASEGSIYGTTMYGGPLGGGTVFRITGRGKLALLHAFQSSAATGPEGFAPSAPLTEAPDGQFVGTTYGGGTWGQGTIFRMTAEGVVTTLHSFSGNDGGRPSGPLVPAGDGGYFGTTQSGPRGASTLYKLTPDGQLKTLQTFAGGAEGPPGDLMLGRDGNLYATTVEGGKDRGGSILRISRTGVVTTLHEFTGGLDGAHPLAPLIQARDGHFYGTTSGGPTARDFEAALRGAPPNMDSLPSVFRMSTGGKVTTLCRLPDAAGGLSALLDSPDGALYGTMASGGSLEAGAVFRLTKDCSLTILHSFSRRPVEDRPHSGLLRTRDGSLWGTTAASGRGGTIYRIGP